MAPTVTEVVLDDYPDQSGVVLLSWSRWRQTPRKNCAPETIVSTTATPMKARAA